MKISKCVLKLLLFGVIFLLSSPVTSRAEEEGVGFTVSPIPSATQIDNDKGYFYFQTEPGKKQTLSVSVFSDRDEDMEIEVWVENAISASTGVLSYSNDAKLFHESLQSPITEIINLKEDSFVLKAREEKVVDLEVTPPSSNYEGIKMGRVVFKEKADDNAKGIVQEFQYAVGIIASESGLIYNDGKMLELEKVQANVSGGNRYIEAFMNAPEPKTMEDMKVRSYVTKKGDTKKLKEKNIDNFAFAPNSKLIFTIPWGLADFESGEYTFYFDGENQFETFKLQQDFTITGDQAKKLNQEAAFAVATPKLMKWIIIGINSVLIILFIVIIQRDRKWKLEIKEKKRARKSKKSKRKKKN